MTALSHVSAAEAQSLVAGGRAVLIDIREPAEHAREHIPGACPVPLNSVASDALPTGEDQILIFHCRSGARTTAAASALSDAAGGCQGAILDGGLMGWKAAGLPVAVDRSKPIDIMRQVQIVAGTLILLGVALAVLVHPGFIALSAFVGAGLMFAGISGFCGMARLLALMPWNRVAT